MLTKFIWFYVCIIIFKQLCNSISFVLRFTDVTVTHCTYHRL